MKLPIKRHNHQRLYKFFSTPPHCKTFQRYSKLSLRSIGFYTIRTYQGIVGYLGTDGLLFVLNRSRWRTQETRIKANVRMKKIHELILKCTSQD